MCFAIFHREWPLNGVPQLAGLHSNGYINDLFAKAFAKEGMKAYVELIQRREREIGCDVLTHQKVRPPSSDFISLSNPVSRYSGAVPTMSIT